MLNIEKELIFREAPLLHLLALTTQKWMFMHLMEEELSGTLCMSKENRIKITSVSGENPAVLGVSLYIISSWLSCAWLSRHLMVTHCMSIKSTSTIQVPLVRKTFHEKEIEDFINNQVSKFRTSNYF